MKQFTRILRKPSEVDDFCRDLTSCPIKGGIQINFGYIPTKRTKSQNRLYRMSISDIASEAKADPEETHLMFVEMFCPEKPVTVAGTTMMSKSTTLLDVGEMKTFWNHVISYAATELNIFVRHPDDQGR